MAAAMRPVIGYTIEFEDPLLRKVEVGLREPLQRFGALPVVLPRETPEELLDELLDMIDGVQLCGGADVHPKRYGAETHPLTKPFRDEQDEFEIELVRRAFARGMPVLGICRGAQVLAVADGGTLTQDVKTLHPGASTHRNSWSDMALEPPGDHWHDIVPEPGSGVERWFDGGPRRVNSFHHQCVSTTGKVLSPAARGADGVIEAVERTDGNGWAMGLQWHNELQWQRDERFLAPFRELVDAARAYAAAKA